MKVNYFFFLFILTSCGSESIESTSNQEFIKETALENTKVDESTEKIIETAVEIEIEDYSYLPDKIDELEISYDGIEVKIWTDKLFDIKLSVRLESSITVMDEGPHCDLINWHHAYTPILKLVDNNRFDIIEDGTVTFDFKEYYEIELDFPIYDMDLIRAEVKTECGSRWSDHIKDVDSPFDYPCGVSISAYIFIIKGFDLQTNEAKEYSIRIPNEMGC